MLAFTVASECRASPGDWRSQLTTVARRGILAVEEWTPMKTLPIVWQRLVQGGQTCDRCAATHNELDSAMAMLRAALKPLGIEPVMEVKEITMIAFTGDPLASNRIWIAGRPMEDWIGATVGRSQCCSVCGDSDCRTVKIGDAEYETVPKEVFIRAALIAAAALLGEPATA